MGFAEPTTAIERQLLSGLTLHFGPALDVLPVLTPDCFTTEIRRLVFTIIRDRLQAGQRVDGLMVMQDHRLNPYRDDEADVFDAADSVSGVCYPPLMPEYARHLRDCADLRSINAAARRLAADSANPQGRKPGDLVSALQDEVLALGMGMTESGGLRPVGADVDGYLDRIEDRAENPDRLLGLSTGIRPLDTELQGLQAGDLILVAGASSMGKTTFALNIAENVAQAHEDQGRVLVFSLEMSREQLMNRMVCSLGGIDAQRMRSARLTHAEYDRLVDVTTWLRRAPLEIDDTGTLSVASLRARTVQARARGKVSLVVVDYLGLLDLQMGDGQNKATGLGEAARRLKLMAKDLGVPVVLLVQLNRKVSERFDKRPLMSDLRDSGEIEQHADVILMVYRDEYYTKGECQEPGIAEIIIEKQRNGPRATVKVGFRGENTRFSELPGYEPPAVLERPRMAPERRGIAQELGT